MEEVNEQSGQTSELLASILIVCHNRKTALTRCLQALESSQDRDRLEIIVLDAGSSDGSNTLDVDFPDVIFLRMPRNFGATKVLNIGIRTAKADRLFLLDPAIAVEPGSVSALVARLEETPDSAAICPLLLGPDNHPLPQVRSLPSAAALRRLWRDPEAAPASTPPPQGMTVVEYPGRRAVLVRKSFLKGMNYFDEGYGEFGGELELAYQIRHAGKKAYIAGDIRAVDYGSQEAPPTWTPGQRALLAADRLNGVAHFMGKRAGAASGWQMRLGATLGVFLRAITMQEPGFQWPLLSALLGGQKIDGSQHGL